MTKQAILDKLESLELQLAELTNMLYTIRKEIEENLE
jgi:regulator of replication initiation timing